MIEEMIVRIKATIDKSSFNQAKKSIEGIGKDTGTKKLTAGLKESSAGAAELHEQLQSIKNMSFTELILGAGKFVNGLTSAKAATKDLMDSMKQDIEELENEYKELSQLAKDYLNPDSMVYSADGYNEDWTGREDALAKSGMMAQEAADAQKALNNKQKEYDNLVKKSAKDSDKLFGVISKGAALAVAAVALLVAQVLALVAAIRNAINVAKELKVTMAEATKIGLDVATYQEWEYILGTVGVEVDKLSDFLKTLADEQNAVRDGSEDIIKAFESLGISAEEAANMTQGELFEKTVAGLQNMENEVERTSTAYRIFGEDAAELTPLLNLNSGEMERLTSNFYLLGGAASDSLIQKSKALNSSLHNLSTAWQGLKNTLAEAFMPAITAVVNWLVKAVAVINMIIKAIFGFEIISKSTKSASSSYGSNFKSMKDGANGAKDAIDKLKRTTMGFDELNVVKNPNADSGGGSGDDGNDYGGVNIPGADGVNSLSGMIDDLDLGGLAAKIEEASGIMRAIVPAAMVAGGAIGGVLAALSGNWLLAVALFGVAGMGLLAMTSGEGGFQGYVDNFATTCNGLLVPAMLGIGAVGAVIALLTANIPLGIACLAMIGSAIALSTTDSFQGLTDGFAAKVTLIVAVAMVAIGVVGGVIALLCGAIPIAIGLFALAGVGLGAITAGGFWDEIGQWFMDLFAGIGQWCSDVWDGICEIFASVGQWFKDRFTEAKEGIAQAWSNLKEWAGEKWDGICQAFGNVKQWFSDRFTQAKEGIANAWSNIGAWAGEKWANIKQSFANTKQWFSDIFKGAWENIKKAFSSVGSFFSGIWDTIKSIFSKVGSTIGNAVSGAFKTAINWVLEKAINLINGFIKGINLAVGIINKIPGVNISTLKLLDVPKMAKGGIVDGSTIANIGEAGREAVLPLENNTEWMDALADRIAARNSTPSKIILKVGERELGEATIQSINGIIQQTGNIPLAFI